MFYIFYNPNQRIILDKVSNLLIYFFMNEANIFQNTKFILTLNKQKIKILFDKIFSKKQCFLQKRK